MTSNASASQAFLDKQQYARSSILRYERIFGHTWVSTGGENTTKEFVLKIKPRRGDKMLDIGCGTGGSACFFARYYGVQVEGVDLSSNMINIAKERIAKEEPNVQNKINYILDDIMKANYPKDSFDIIYSRDTILHIREKEQLFVKLFNWLKPGGKLFISDYCRGDQKHSKEFLDYVDQRGYDLRTVGEYGEVIRQAGFKYVEATDATSMFRRVLEDELRFFEPTKEYFIQEFSEKDYNEIVDGWRQKQSRCKVGDQAWGVFYATKRT